MVFPPGSAVAARGGAMPAVPLYPPVGPLTGQRLTVSERTL